MMLEKLIVFVEEYSMEALLEQLLPRLIGTVGFEVHHFKSKQGLLKHLPKRLAAYGKWLPANQKILVLLDRDDDDCRTLKQQLEKMAFHAGLKTKTIAGDSQPFQVVNRIVPESIPRKAAFRNPDAIQGGTWERFEQVLQSAGYFSTGLRKLECAKAVGRYMRPERNTSPSFQAFCKALASILQIPI